MQKQFLALAENALEKAYLAAFIDNLFSASELIAKTQLLTLWSNPQLQNKPSHKTIRRRYNHFAHLGNVEDDHIRAFNKLSEMRIRARYLKGEISLTDAECKEMLEAVQQMLKETETIINHGQVNSDS